MERTWRAYRAALDWMGPSSVQTLTRRSLEVREHDRELGSSTMEVRM